MIIMQTLLITIERGCLPGVTDKSLQLQTRDYTGKTSTSTLHRVLNRVNPEI